MSGRREALTDSELEVEGKVADEESRYVVDVIVFLSDWNCNLFIVSCRLVDWAKLACLLCSRGFKDAATLQKHRSFSSLHIENLNKLRTKHGLGPLPIPSVTDVGANSSGTVTIASLLQIGAQAATEHAKSVASRQGVNVATSGCVQYRDRAKERREKYGVAPPPKYHHPEDVVSQPSVLPDSTSAPGCSASPVMPSGELPILCILLYDMLKA